MGFKSVLRKVGKVASIAAPIVAAPFTGGATLALIGAGAGAANSALSHGGVKGALLGAGLGAIPGVGGAKGAARGVGESVAHAITRAAVNPRALTSIAGQSIGGRTGSVVQGASNLLPGARAYTAPGSNSGRTGNSGYFGSPNPSGGGDGSNTSAGPGGVVGFLSKLKAAGIDPTTLGLGALSLFGGDDQQRRQSYGGAGRVDPYTALQSRSDQITSLINQLQSAPKFEQHAPPAPITIPGIPFQIGGGLNGPLAGLDVEPGQRKQVA